MDEGYIKFNCNWIKAKALPKDQIKDINACRDCLYKLGLVGAYDNGIGYGNISIRFDKVQSFLITGSATGNLATLNENHYVLVIEYNIEQNNLICTGPIKASSESLSHAMVYKCSEETNAVIHIHNLDLWEKLIYKVPTTNKHISFGTPEIANEIKRLFNETSVADEKIIVMGGHKEGIISFGKNLKEASEILLKKM